MKHLTRMLGASLIGLVTCVNVGAKSFTEDMPRPKILPDHQQYSDFLLEPYKPGKPSVVVFKDPHCGYCIRALKNLDYVKEYNVYMFWAGILGERSEQKVAQIMQCAEPISKAVFDDVIERANTINCQTGDEQSIARLNQLNDQVVANYEPRSVPSYYFGGRKVYVSQLKKFKRSLQTNITPIQLDWQRYESLRVDNTKHTGLANAIVFMPKDSIKRQYVLDALAQDSKYSWHLVEAGCEQGNKCSKRQKLGEELKLLMNLSSDDLTKAQAVVNGTVINPKRYSQYFSKGLAMMLVSK